MQKLKISLISAASLGIMSLGIANQHVSADTNNNDYEISQIQNLDLNQSNIKLQDTSNSIKDKQNSIQDLQNRIKQIQDNISSAQNSVNKQISSTMDKNQDNDLEKLIIDQNGKNEDSIKKIQSLKLLKVTDSQQVNKNKDNLNQLQDQQKDLQNQLNDLNKLQDQIKSHTDQLTKDAQQKEQQSRTINGPSSSSQVTELSNTSSSNATQASSVSGSVDPAKYGMDFGSIKGWSGHWYSGTPYASQCTEFVSSLMNAVYGLNVQNSNGIGMAAKYAALDGGQVTSTPSAGSVLSMRSISADGHTAFVEKVNNDGSVVIVESNTPWSGNLSGKLYTWNYRTISASELHSAGAQYYHPKGNMRNV